MIDKVMMTLWTDPIMATDLMCVTNMATHAMWVMWKDPVTQVVEINLSPIHRSRVPYADLLYMTTSDAGSD